MDSVEGACSAFSTQPGIQDVIWAGLANFFAGIEFDELVQCMVQDAPLDRQDRRGPKLI
jgi:hypothetical protein